MLLLSNNSFNSFVNILQNYYIANHVRNDSQVPEMNHIRAHQDRVLQVCFVWERERKRCIAMAEIIPRVSQQRICSDKRRVTEETKAEGRQAWLRVSSERAAEAARRKIRGRRRWHCDYVKNLLPVELRWTDTLEGVSDAPHPQLRSYATFARGTSLAPHYCCLRACRLFQVSSSLSLSSWSSPLSSCSSSSSRRRTGNRDYSAVLRAASRNAINGYY